MENQKNIEAAKKLRNNLAASIAALDKVIDETDLPYVMPVIAEMLRNGLAEAGV